MDEDSPDRVDISGLIGLGSGLLGKLFTSLAPDVAAQLQAQADLREVPTGGIILENGQIPSEIGYVIDGSWAWCRSLITSDRI